MFTEEDLSCIVAFCRHFHEALSFKSYLVVLTINIFTSVRFWERSSNTLQYIALVIWSHAYELLNWLFHEPNSPFVKKKFLDERVVVSSCLGMTRKRFRVWPHWQPNSGIDYIVQFSMQILWKDPGFFS